MGEMTSPTTSRVDFYRDPDVREQVADQMIDLDSLYMALPDEHGCALPDEGGWVILKRLPHTNLPNPPLYSIWWARPVYATRSVKVVAGSRKRRLTWPMLKARIQTEHGDLDFLASEMQPTDLSKWLELIGEGVTLHLLDDADSARMNDAVFYAQSRGLRYTEALALALPEINKPGVAYLTLDI